MDKELKSITSINTKVNIEIERKVNEDLQDKIDNIFGFYNEAFIVIPIYESIKTSTRNRDRDREIF